MLMRWMRFRGGTDTSSVGSGACLTLVGGLPLPCNNIMMSILQHAGQSLSISMTVFEALPGPCMLKALRL